MKKKFLALFLSALMMLAVFSSCGGNKPKGTLVVGGNAINADMFDGYSNLVLNSDIKKIINGYSTIAYTKEDTFIVDPVVVKEMETINNDDGSVTYKLQINKGLKWNDGTEIKAKDFLFALLFDCSPELVEMENDRAVGNEVYLGFEAYYTGETDVFAGAHLIDEYTLSLTIPEKDDAGNNNFPFWYAITYAMISPLPMHVLAPGCDVVDEGDGAKITGPFSVELLRETLDNGSTGYRYTPTVTCGPYSFVSFSEADNQAVLEANPNYAGNYNKSQPKIQKLVMKLVDDATAIEELRTGSVDLLLAMSGGTKINAGLDLVDSTDNITYFSYPRNGYGKILLHCSEGPTQFVEVRRAIAWCMDREEFVRQYTQGFGVISHTRAGLAQWMYTENKEYLDENLTVYTLNTDKAKEELVNGGWVYNADGSDYVEGKGIRHKKMDDGTYMPLELEWFSPNSNNIGEMLNTFIVPNAESVGMKINQTFGDSAAHGEAVYGYSEKYYNMINGGSGFVPMDSPWYYYDPTKFGPYNSNLIDDTVLFETTRAMREVEPGNRDEYSEKWLEFVMRFNEVLPDIPLYSDEYHDFFNTKLKDYEHSALWPWYSAILDASVEE